MRKLINELLVNFGYRIEKVSRFSELLKKQYKNRGEFAFIQVGANDGIRFDDLYSFVTIIKSKGVVVEPLPDFHDVLSTVYRHYPDITARQVAIHPTQKKCTLYRVDPDRLHELPPWAAGIASLDPHHHERTKIAKEYIIEEEVDAVSLMELIKESGFHQIDLLQIDVEGFDAEVIKMIDFDKCKPAIIKYEHGSLEQNEIVKVKALLRSHGYKLFMDEPDTIAYL